MKNTDQTSWLNDELPPLQYAENNIQASQLASIRRILIYSSKYWGGTFSLIAMMLFVTGLIYLVTNEFLYGLCRVWIADSVSALISLNFATLFSLLWPFALALTLVLAVYWLLIKRFFHHKESIQAWALTCLILLLATMNVKVGVELVEWSGSFWESVKNKEVERFIPGLILFAQLAFFSIIAGTYRIFFSQMLQIRWRTWLTAHLTQRYLSANRFYHLNQQKTQDNPDQRIADDLDRFTNLGVGLFFGFYLAALSIYEYSKILIKISGNLEFSWLGQDFNIPYYMFWSVILYTIVGSILIHYIGRRLVKINVLSQQYNADFRYHLIRAREYSEGIGFLKGEQNHIKTARHLFGVIRANWMTLMWRIKLLGFSSSIYGQTAIIFPVIVAIPRYFSGALNFGGVMQVIRTFGELSNSLSWFIDQYSVISELRAAATRIFSLETALAQVDELKQQSSLIVLPNNIGGIAFTHVSLTRPQSNHNMALQTQVTGLDWQISQGQRWLISGASGSGKSTILRAIAGLWPYGDGQIDVPSKGKVQFLPQRSYFPIASLRDALAYPETAQAYKDIAYQAVLEMSQLSHLSDRLSEVNNWGEILSGGEQQRLAFARIFLQRPDYLFLDEATSSLDVANEKSLYATLLESLPNITLVSVSHHEQLVEYHSHCLTLQANDVGEFEAQMNTF